LELLTAFHSVFKDTLTQGIIALIREALDGAAQTRKDQNALMTLKKKYDAALAWHLSSI